MASMSRKFFTALAYELRGVRPPAEAEQLYAVWHHTVTATANVIESQAAQFNRERFFEACGVLTAGA